MPARTQTDQAQSTVVWSPITVVLPFKASLTPNFSQPLTPYASTPLPYFSFSPTANTQSMNAQIAPSGLSTKPPQVDTGAPSPSTTVELPPITTPILQPAPGSKLRPAVRNRGAGTAVVLNSAQSSGSAKVVSTPQTPRSQDNVLAIKSLLTSPRTPKCITPSSTFTFKQDTNNYDNSAPNTVRDVDLETVSMTVNKGSPFSVNLELQTPSPSASSSSEHEGHSDLSKTSTQNKGGKRTRKAKTNSIDKFMPDAGIVTTSSGSFKCPICSKYFKFKKHCRRHMIIHTGNKPYKCTFCSQTYFRKDTCKRHTAKCQTRSRAKKSIKATGVKKSARAKPADSPLVAS